MDTFLETEISRPIGSNTLKWLLDQGFVHLMLDGLDEILAVDDNFFSDFLLDRVTVPDGHSQILICVRDSLFNSCTSLTEFIEAMAGDVEIFKLCDWDLSTQRDYSARRFAVSPN